MNSINHKALKATAKKRGATMVEYVLILAAVLGISAAAYSQLGSNVKTGATTAGDLVINPGHGK